MSPADIPWAEELIGRDFGGRMQARKGQLVDALGQAGLVAEDGAERLGLLTYQIVDDQVEIVTFQAVGRLGGVGTALLAEFLERIEDRTAWLITTNDNLDALRFYQRRGFRICAVYPGAVDEARMNLKPSIPVVGGYGIAIRDEIELCYEGAGSARHRHE